MPARVEKRSTKGLASTPAAPPSSQAPGGQGPRPVANCRHDWAPTVEAGQGDDAGLLIQTGPWVCKLCHAERDVLPVGDVPPSWLRGDMAAAVSLRVEKAPEPGPVLLRIDDIAREYGVTDRVVRSWMQRQLIPYEPVGRSKAKHVDRAALERRVPARTDR